MRHLTKKQGQPKVSFQIDDHHNSVSYKQQQAYSSYLARSHIRRNEESNIHQSIHDQTQLYIDNYLGRSTLSEQELQTQHENPEMNIKRNINLHSFDDLNRTVKQIMKSNEQYRQKLLAACQQKAKVRLQNTILQKSLQNAEQQKELLNNQNEHIGLMVKGLENQLNAYKQHSNRVIKRMEQQAISQYAEIDEMRNKIYTLQNQCNELKAKITQNCNIEKNLVLMKQNSLEQQERMKIALSTQRDKSKNIQIKLKRLQQNYEASINLHGIVEQELKNVKNENNNLKLTILRFQDQYDSLCKQNKILAMQNRSLKNSQSEAVSRIAKLEQVLSTAQRSNRSLKEMLRIYQIEEQEDIAHKTRLASPQSKFELLQHQYLSHQERLRRFKSNQFNSLKYLHQDNITKDQYLKKDRQYIQQRFERQIRRAEELANLNQQKEDQNRKINIELSKKDDRIYHLEHEIQLQKKSIEQQTAFADKLKSQIAKNQSQLKDLQQNNHNISLDLKKAELRVNDLQSKHKKQLKICQDALIQKDLMSKQLQRDFKLSFEDREQKLNRQIQQLKSMLRSKISQSSAQNQQLQLRITKAQLQIVELIHSNQEKQETIKEKDKIIENKGIIKFQALCQKNEQLKSQLFQLKSQNNQLQARVQGQQIQLKKQIAQIQRLKQSHHNKQLANKSQIELLKKSNKDLLQTLNACQIQTRAEFKLLQQQLNQCKNQSNKYLIAQETLRNMQKQFAHLEDISLQITKQPRFSIKKFTNHLSVLHRSAFTREIERIEHYVDRIAAVGHEITKHNSNIRLAINIISNKGIYTFGPAGYKSNKHQ